MADSEGKLTRSAFGAGTILLCSAARLVHSAGIWRKSTFILS